MKKWKVILTILMILFLFSGIGYGTSNKIIHVGMNGSNVPVTKVPIIKDGQVIDMEFPSFVYIDRTLVPVRFVAENLGAKVDWDHKTQTAIVNHKGKKIELTIDSNVATINNEKKNLDRNSIPRLVTMDNRDARTMVPLAFMSEMLGYDVGWDSEAKSAYINSEKKEEITEKPNEPVKEPPVKEPNDKIDEKLLNKVVKVAKEKVDGQEAIVIHGTKDISHKVMKLKNPERIVVDLLDSNLQGSTYEEFKYELGFIKGVRVSQFVPDNNYNPGDKIVRIVLDTKDGVLDPSVKISTNNNKIVIFPERSSWENLNYHVDGRDRTITINNLMETSYSVNYDSTRKKMEISIPKNSVELIPGILPIKDGLVDEIKIVESSAETKIFIQFIRGIEYNVLSNKVDNKIILQMKRDTDIKPGDRIIVIDPGHGGRDSGAVSANKVREKDLVLDLSLKIQNGLEQKGYNVIMVRDTDVFVGLYDRAKVANESFADIFVSIHANAATNKSANGVEVLYAPASGNPNKIDNQHPLAKAILDELLRATGANSRGTISRPNLVVLRETKMPASLVEVGFLSNAEEEKLITNKDYQDKIVSGIIKGIEKYFDEY